MAGSRCVRTNPCKALSLCLGWGRPESGEREVAVLALSLCFTQLRHLASMAVWVSHEHLLLHISSLQSPQAFSSQPVAVLSLGLLMIQHPGPIHTGRHMFQAEAHRIVAQVICVGLTLSCLPPKWPFCFPLTAPGYFLLSQPISHWWENFPGCGNLSAPSAAPSCGCGSSSCFLSSSFSLFFSYLLECREYFFVLSDVRGLLLMFNCYELFCLYFTYLWRDEVYIFLLLHHLVFSVIIGTTLYASRSSTSSFIN